MPLRARLVLIATALAGAAIEVVVVAAGSPAGLALLDLAAGWALLAAAAGANALRDGCRRVIAAAAALWFAGTLGSAGGDVGRAADLWASLYSALLAGACLAAPGAWPRGRAERVVVAWTWVRGLVPALASANGVTFATGAVVAVLGFARRDRDRRMATGHRAAGAFGTALALAALLRVAGADPELATAVVSLGVAAAGGALLAGGRRLSPGGVSSLVVDLGRLHDARSLEQRLAVALGDPRLELRYRLRAGGAWLDAAGRSVPPPSSPRGEVTTVEAGDVGAALLHDAGALEDPQLRAAVLEAVRLAVVRLGMSAHALAQAEALAGSRRRLVTAAQREREQFAREVESGPGALLAGATSALDDAVRAAPAELADLLTTAAADLAATRAELAASVGGGLADRLGARGLEEPLAELARRAGANADVRLAAPVGSEVAAVAWFCASEALANALKHAGAAPITLTAHEQNHRLVLVIADDGPGGADPSGGGLVGLRARAAALGGEVTVDSPHGSGTRVVVELPLSAPSARHARS